MEANLASVVGVHEPQVGASIESRLQTVINSMAADEQRHAKTLAENAKVRRRAENKDGSSCSSCCF